MIMVDGKYSKEMIDLRSLNLLNLGGQLKAGRGLAFTVAFVNSGGSHDEDRRKADQIKEHIQHDMQQVKLQGFAKSLIYSEDQIKGMIFIIELIKR
jgi:hypothetical protein